MNHTEPLCQAPAYMHACYAIAGKLDTSDFRQCMMAWILCMAVSRHFCKSLFVPYAPGALQDVRTLCPTPVTPCSPPLASNAATAMREQQQQQHAAGMRQCCGLGGLRRRNVHRLGRYACYSTQLAF